MGTKGHREKQAEEASDIERLLTEKQLARMLDVSNRTVQHWRQTGYGPPFLKLARGRLVRYRISAVEEWLNIQTVKSTSQSS